ncbi:uncharacterized protein LOC100878345 [Anopheles sinensis]|uniref:Uncharacterized protein LOC100878345 n=1 Tax=Anopheles sinensis TaxID=74873 RepID=A0A084WFJ6_ANOSI|nr:uncharacterized protein LOC100878345 [Anopheles sinensis]
MPKIFLIKNRLHQQQLRLVEEAQKNSHVGPGGGSVGVGSVVDSVGSGSDDGNEPLSLVSRKREHEDSVDRFWPNTMISFATQNSVAALRRLHAFVSTLSREIENTSREKAQGRKVANSRRSAHFSGILRGNPE